MVSRTNGSYGTAGGRAVDATIVAYRFPSATNWFTIVTPAGSGLGALAPLVQSVALLKIGRAHV